MCDANAREAVFSHKPTGAATHIEITVRSGIRSTVPRTLLSQPGANCSPNFASACLEDERLWPENTNDPGTPPRRLRDTLILITHSQSVRRARRPRMRNTRTPHISVRACSTMPCWLWQSLELRSPRTSPSRHGLVSILHTAVRTQAVIWCSRAARAGFSACPCPYGAF